ncbi:MAG TPA: hypothetical protein VIV61_19370 [Candidatus Ozemobacteraceae bacterium]
MLRRRPWSCSLASNKPYRFTGGKFPGKTTIQSRLEPGVELLPERGIVVTGFLIGELARRLGNLRLAREYFDEVLALPFLSKYSSLLTHIHHVNRLLKEAETAAASRIPEKR